MQALANWRILTDVWDFSVELCEGKYNVIKYRNKLGIQTTKLILAYSHKIVVNSHATWISQARWTT